jgi:N-hydroxyarylamine O-acetyltransferase
MTNVDAARRAVTDGYLAAVGLERVDPSLEFLSALTRCHVGEFAFSSIGPRLGDQLPIDLDSLFDRIVVRRRGGYCFEHNGLLFEVLTDLGFAPRLQMARVVLGRDIHPGLTHRVARVVLDGREFVVDVGFGPMGPPHPVPMAAGAARDELLRAGYRIHSTTGGVHELQHVVDGSWFTLYRFDDVTYGQADAEVGHFYSHLHPEAVFVNNLVASRILDDEVRSLRNHDYWVIRDAGTTSERIAGAERLHALLTQELGLQVTVEECERLFAALPPA